MISIEDTLFLFKLIS